MVKLLKMAYYSSLIGVLFLFSHINVFAASYNYDNLHRLTQIERSDGAIITFTYDNLGNRISKTATASIAGGDLNGDGRVDLSDVILSLQIVSGTEPLGTISAAADVNDDGQIGIEETIFMMREVSGL